MRLARLECCGCVLCRSIRCNLNVSAVLDFLVEVDGWAWYVIIIVIIIIVTSHYHVLSSCYGLLDIGHFS